MALLDTLLVSDLLGIGLVQEKLVIDLKVRRVAVAHFLDASVTKTKDLSPRTGQQDGRMCGNDKLRPAFGSQFL